MGTGRSSPPAPNARPSRASRPGHVEDVAAPFITSGDGRRTSTLSVARRAGRRNKSRMGAPHGRRNAQGKPASYAKTASRQRATMRGSAPTLAASARIGCHASSSGRFDHLSLRWETLLAPRLPWWAGCATAHICMGQAFRDQQRSYIPSARFERSARTPVVAGGGAFRPNAAGASDALQVEAASCHKLPQPERRSIA
jgi:hypothetical protein